MIHLNKMLCVTDHKSQGRVTTYLLACLIILFINILRQQLHSSMTSFDVSDELFRRWLRLIHKAWSMYYFMQLIIILTVEGLTVLCCCMLICLACSIQTHTFTQLITSNVITSTPAVFHL